MNYLMPLCFLLSLALKGNAQQKTFVDLVISIDSNIPSETITDFKIAATWKDGHQELFKCDYYPGYLQLKDSVYSKVSSENLLSISFKFYNTIVCNTKTKTQLYTVEVSRNFFNHKYYLINISNKNSKYNYDLIYPGGAVTRTMHPEHLCD